MRYKKGIVYCVDSEALEQVAQRSCGCPLPGSVQGQVGRGLEQPGLVEGVPACSRVVGTRCSLRSLPTLTILFYDSFLTERRILRLCLWDVRFFFSFYLFDKEKNLFGYTVKTFH